MKMQGFRKAFVRASDAGNQWRQVNYIVLEDKPTVSVSGILPLQGRTSVGTSASALRSIDMFANQDYGVLADLPRVDYEINDRRHTFTTAAYREYTAHDNMRSKEDIEDWDGIGPCWQWKIVTLDEIEPPTSVDVDEDGYEEYVMEKDGNILKVIDYQEGEFDSAVEDVGIEQDYIKRSLVSSSTFTRQEDTTGITTIDNIDTQDIFYRTIKLREEEYYDVEDNLATKRKATWSTPH
jgi:hypothetical protein